MKYHLIAGLIATVFCTYQASANSLKEAVQTDYKNHLEDLFVHFHQNPELSFREFKTAKRIASELRDLGVEVTENVGQTGVVGILKNGEGPTVMIRADMDGLPVKEKSGLDYSSSVVQTDLDGIEKPVMHACGHDVHITSLVGTARQLVSMKEQWSGTVMFVAQPAEERISGAKAMLDDGLFERFVKPDYALAFHISPAGPVGKVHVKGGHVGASVDSVNITVYGIGTHGAAPHRGKDPIYIASQIVVGLQSLISREISPIQPGVVTVGSFHGGFKHNVIPGKVDLELTVRADSEKTRKTLLNGIKRIAEGVARTAGMPEDKLPKVEWGFESTPTFANNEALAERIGNTFIKKLGKDRMYSVPRLGMGGEDFAYYAQPEHQVASLYFQVGGSNQADLDAQRTGGPRIAPNHSPFFKVEAEPSVTTGVEAMTIAVMELLPK